MIQEYHLFRTKFIKPKQLNLLLDKDPLPSEIFQKAIYEMPSTVTFKKYLWQIGNIHDLGPDCGYFAIGRNTVTKIPKFEQARREFVDVEDDSSPYTFIVYDAQIGMVAIRKKFSLAPTTENIARRLQDLLCNSEIVRTLGVDVLVGMIHDPLSFIDKIRRSYAVREFTAHFTGPNPFDADELFQKPLSVYIKSAGGTEGRATIEGDDLDREVIESVTRSTVASANVATAKIREEHNSRTKKIYLSGNPVAVLFDTEEEVHPKDVLAAAQSAYLKVRHENY